MCEHTLIGFLSADGWTWTTDPEIMSFVASAFKRLTIKADNFYCIEHMQMVLRIYMVVILELLQNKDKSV